MSIICPLILSAFCLVSCDSDPGSNVGEGPDTTKTDTQVVTAHVAPLYNSPEGVTSDGQFIYVSNVGVKLEPQAKDGDGRIMKLDMAATNWIDKDKWAAIKLDAPKGMVIVGTTLYVTDIDHVVGIDLNKVEQTATFDFSSFKATFLNDIAVKNDSILLVSATDLNAIFEINLHTQKVSKLKTGTLNGPNGLAYESEGNKIYCVEMGGENDGRVLAIDANTGAIRQIGKYRGSLDGLAFAADGSLLFSDWSKSHVERMAMPSGTVTEVPSDSVHGPADFHYSIASKKLYLPRMKENRLLILEGI